MENELIKAARQALEVLTDRGQLNPNDYKELKNDVITALRRALEQPDQFAQPRNMVEQPAQQEPVAWMCHPFGDDECEFTTQQECENCIPLYTRPQAREWVGLTDVEIHQCLDVADGRMSRLIAVIEAKLREKNA